MNVTPGFCPRQLEHTSDFATWGFFVVDFLVYSFFSNLLDDFHDLYPKWKCSIFTDLNFS